LYKYSDNPFNSNKGRKAITALRPLASLFLILSFTVFAHTLSRNIWTVQRSGVMTRLNSVYFLDSSRGWVVGGNGLLLVTEDGGRNWKASPRSVTDNFRDVHFFNSSTGLILVEKSLHNLKSETEPRSYLLKTTDGGKNWTRIDFGLSSVERNPLLIRFVFAGQNGWAFGEEGQIASTEDGGNSWRRLQSNTRSLLLSAYFHDNQRGWIAGAASTVIFTADGGKSWTQGRVPVSNLRINGLSFMDQSRGIAVCSAGTILSTTNGGKSWQPLLYKAEVDLFDVKYTGDRQVWVAGDGGTLLKSMDAGQSWQQEKSGTRHPIYRLFFTARDKGWAVGYGGTILHFASAADPAPKLIKSGSLSR
jgi:photosystem II stability/assembly factor-like uncharacterized protein